MYRPLVIKYHLQMLEANEVMGFANSHNHDSDIDYFLWYLGHHHLLDRAQSHYLRALICELTGSEIVEGGKVED